MDQLLNNDSYQNQNNVQVNKANIDGSIASDNVAPASIPEAQQNTDTQQQSGGYNFVAEGAENRKRSGGGVFGGIIKLLIILIVPITMTGLVGMFFKARAEDVAVDKAKGVVMKIPMKDTNWKDIGNVFEPLITLPIKVQDSYQDWEFLLDSGAVISSLPREWADKMGKDIDKMKRSVFKGFGSKMSFAYQGEMTVLIGEEDVDLPVVFTESSGTKSLIGRKGFFQEFSVYFNHKDKVIEIIK